MASIASLIVRIGAQDQEIQKALASVGEKARSLDADLKKLGSSPLAGAAQKSLETMNATIKTITESQQRLAERATFAAQGLEAMGGASRLTDTQLKQVNKTLQDGLSAYKALGTDAPESLRKVSTEVQGLATKTKTLTDLKGAVVSLGAAFGVTLSVGAVIAFGKELLRMGDDIVRVADRTGLLTDEVQKLSFISAQSGNSIDELTGAIGQMQNRLASGDKSAIAAVKQLGISFEELRAAGPYQQLQLIAEAVGKIENPANKAQVAMDLFGRSGIAILPTLTAKFKELGDEAPVMSHKTVLALDQAGDALNKFTLSVKVWAAESYNFFGRVFDQFSILVLKTTAGFLDVSANILAVTQKIPGADKLFPGLAEGINDLRLRAQFARDAAQGLAMGLDASGEAAKKAVPGFASVGTTVDKTADQFSKMSAAVMGSNFAWERQLDLAKALSGILPQLESRSFNNMGNNQVPQIGNLPSTGSFGFGLPGPDSHGRTIPDITAAAREDMAAGKSTGTIMDSLKALKAEWLDVGKVGSNIAKGFLQNIGAMLSGGVTSLISFGLGKLVSGVKALFHIGTEESTQVNPLRDAFFKAAGGLDVLNPKVLQLTGNLKAVEDVFKAKTVDDYNAAIQRLNAVLDTGKQAQEELKAAVSEYGFTIDELGPKFAQLQLNDVQGNLLKKWKLLSVAVEDHNALLTRTAGSFQEVVTGALKSGATISDELRGPIEELLQMGKLVDENGNQLTDLSRLTFGSLDTEFSKLTAAINNLTRALGGAVDQVDELAKDRDFNITGHVKTDTSSFPTPSSDGFDVPLEPFAGGSHGWRNFGAGTPAILHGMEAVVTPADMAASKKFAGASQARDVAIYIDRIITPDDPESLAANLKRVVRDNTGGVYDVLQTVALRAVQ